MVGVWICSQWRERETGEEGTEKLERGNFFFFLRNNYNMQEIIFLVIYFSE